MTKQTPQMKPQTHKQRRPIIDITKTSLFKYTENFTTKKWKFSDKNSEIFHIYAQNIDCGYLLEPPHRGGSNEYPQSMFLHRNKKNNVYPCKPQFYYTKVGFKGGSTLYRHVFVMRIRLATVGRKTTEVINQFYSRETSTLILMQLQVANIC